MKGGETASSSHVHTLILVYWVYNLITYFWGTAKTYLIRHAQIYHTEHAMKCTGSQY